MSVSSFTLIFGLAEGPRLDLLAAAVVTQWPQMNNEPNDPKDQQNDPTWPKNFNRSSIHECE